MIDVTISGVERIVSDINEDLFELIEDEMYYVTYVSDGSVVAVMFLDMCLWDDDNDEREYIEETDEFEDLEEFLRTRMNKMFERLGKLEV